jgi:dipeptidyl aminopeptidase/acylaminoacyl peptidase
VERSIAVRYFVATQIDAGNQLIETGQPIVWAPDQRHFFVATRHGNLSCDCNVYELQVFSRESVVRAFDVANRGSVEPLGTVTLRSSSNLPAISSARWDAEGKNIVFIGTDAEHGWLQVYRFELQSRSVRALTAATNGVEYQLDLVGDSLIYKSLERKEPLPETSQYPASVLTQERLFRAFLGVKEKYVYALFSIYQGHPAKRLISFAPAAVPGPWLSPNGRWAITVMSSPEWPTPAAWRGYGDASLAADSNVNDDWRFAQFVCIDLKLGTVRPIVNAPWGMATRVSNPKQPNDADAVQPGVVWSADSQHAILVNTALPLEPAGEARRRSAYVVDFRPNESRWTVLERVAPGRGGQAYVPDETRWLKKSGARQQRLVILSAANIKDDLQVMARESANDPPAVVAAIGSREITLMSPDPALHGIWRAPAETYQWREPDGLMVKGLLMRPRGKAAAPVPLVIQAYNYLPKVFRPDGPHSEAYAAQALVAQGMAVLQIDIPGIVDRKELAETPREGAAFVQRIDAAVKALAAEGLIDPARVGVIGFSRAGYQTYYAVTHPGEVRLAAAIDADGWTGDYGDYLTSVIVNRGARLDYEQVNGGPFWQNKTSWLATATTFNIDRVTTPLLYTADTNLVTTLPFEMFGAFRINDRPLEIMQFPQGVHPLKRPRERLVSLSTSVAWMAFWLQDWEIADAEDKERIPRWLKLREQRDRALKSLSKSC